MAKETPKTSVPAIHEEAAEAPKKKSKVKKIVILLVILLIIVSAGAGGAYWWFFLRVPPPPGGGAAAPVAPSAGAASPGKESSPRVERVSDLPRSVGKVLPLPQFVVNLADPAGKRVLKLGMEVEANADIAKELQANDARIRDAVITLLAGKSFAEVQSPEGKVLLRAEVAARLNQILGAPKIVRVYFTEFIVE
ncbi:MAG: flagellar basal body-associated FliL family protein [Deltaproteobacteria bacterium]|jgi:flagellar FliL protein|nr:flagellar basal body-associated FliL family protein [Deltaproteobacteria bacterium]